MVELVYSQLIVLRVSRWGETVLNHVWSAGWSVKRKVAPDKMVRDCWIRLRMSHSIRGDGGSVERRKRNEIIGNRSGLQ